MGINISVDSIRDASLSVVAAGKDCVMWGFRQVSAAYNNVLVPTISKIANGTLHHMNSHRSMGLVLAFIGGCSMYNSQHNTIEKNEDGNVDFSFLSGSLLLVTGAALAFFGAGKTFV